MLRTRCTVNFGLANTSVDPILRELGPIAANDHTLGHYLDNKTANHHVLARLHKAASADVARATSGELRLWPAVRRSQRLLWPSPAMAK